MSQQDGHHECTMCELGITWDGGFQTWVHWWNGSIYCPDKTASVISLPDYLQAAEVRLGQEDQ